MKEPQSTAPQPVNFVPERHRPVPGLAFFLLWQLSIVAVIAVMHVESMKHEAFMPLSLDDRPLASAMLAGMTWGWATAAIAIWWRMRFAPVVRRLLAVLFLPPIFTVFAGTLGCFPGGLLSSLLYRILP